MQRLAHAAVLLAVGLSVPACQDEPLGTPTPPMSEVMIELETPAPSEGAIVLSIAGTDSAKVITSPYPWVFVHTVDEVVRIAVIGAIVDGEVVRLAVPTASLPSIQVSIDEVADPSNQLRPDLASYFVTLQEQ